MSKKLFSSGLHLRVALVAEGPTDQIVIEAALKAILHDPFTLTQIQPEPTTPRYGNGWCGVLKWCEEVSRRHSGPLTNDPLLQNNPYDFFIIHLDIDVALKTYTDCGGIIQAYSQTKNWAALPCAKPCPPISNTGAEIMKVIDSWLSPATLGGKTILCLPAQSSGTWLAAATLQSSHPLLAGAECNPHLESRLAQLSKKHRIKKSVTAYRKNASQLTHNWEQVKQICSQASRFEQSVVSALKT